MDRVFLDANVLFSAAWLEGAGLLALWKLPDVELITSSYTLEEARVNLNSPERRRRLEGIVSKVRVLDSFPAVRLPASVALPDKDRPVLEAAVSVGAHFLLTGDGRHFGPYYGRKIEGVLILPPSEYLRLRRKKSGRRP